MNQKSLKKTQIGEFPEGELYIWGSQKYGYTLYLVPSESSLDRVKGKPESVRHARGFFTESPYKNIQDLALKAQWVLGLGVRGQFKIIPDAESKTLRLKYRRYVPQAVREKYRQEKQALVVVWLPVLLCERSV